MDNGQQNQEMLANNDKFQGGFDNSITFMDVMNEINRDDYKRAHFRRYIQRFYEAWKNEDLFKKANDGYHRVLGSKIVFPENKELNDLFTDSSLINVIDYFITNNVRTVSDITKEVLMKLMVYPNVDYMTFKATTDLLFVEKNVNETLKNNDDKQNYDSIHAHELDEDKILKETLWFTSTLQEEVEKRQQLIIDLQTLYLNTKSKAAEQQQMIEEMKLKEMELQETIRKQQEAIIEMQDLHRDQLRNKDQEIDSRDRALATKEQDLSHKNMLITSIEANLEIKIEELNSANQELRAKDTLIAERDANLEKIIQELDLTNRELSAKSMLHADCEADLETKNQELVIANQELVAKDKLLTDREMELAVVTQELEYLREEKAAEKRSFIEFTRVKETMQNVIKLLRGENDSESSTEKQEKEIS